MMDILAHLVWREPLWFWFALCPWLLWLLHGFMGWTRGRDYADPQLMPWARAHVAAQLELRRFRRHALLALAWLLFAMAMAGPRVAQTTYDQDRKNDTQLMVVLDVSRSMTARDVEPSRLERARLELEDLITREQRLKIGLVVYAGRPHLMLPPTADKSVLRHALSVVREGLLPTEGSNLPAAIEFAAGHFTSDQSARALLLITDGEMPTQQATAEAALGDAVVRLAQQGIVFYALGLGTAEGAPLQSSQGDWLHYRDKAVISILHEDRLRQLASLGGGVYADVSDTDAEWRKLYDRNIRYLHNTHTGDSLVEWRELYHWCLVPAFLLLLLAHVEPRRKSLRTSPLVWLLVFVLSGSLLPPEVYADSESWQRRAYQAYNNQSYRQAMQDYAHVVGYDGRMGEGSSAYRLGEYPKAIQLFTQAILDANTDAQRARAVFNLANSRYQLEDYSAAVALYREALRYQPGDRAAQLNLEFAVAMQEQQRQRDKDDVDSGRQGRGPRTALLPDGTNVIGGRLSNDNEEDKRPLGVPLPPVIESQSETDPVALSIHQSQPAVHQATRFKDPTWHYANTSPQRIVLQANALRVDESLLWQRIFEGEEGFPAAIDVPRQLSDILPW